MHIHNVGITTNSLEVFNSAQYEMGMNGNACPTISD